MKDYKLENGTEIKYKTSINEAEYLTLLDMSLDAYQHGIGDVVDEIAFIPYNPIKAEQAFYRVLLEMVVQDYDKEMYNIYFSSGAHKTIRDSVINAQDAWNTMEYLISNSLNVSVVINNFLNKLLDIVDTKLPEGDKMVKALNKLPKEWTKVFKEFQEITGVEEKQEQKQENIDK